MSKPYKVIIRSLRIPIWDFIYLIFTGLLEKVRLRHQSFFLFDLGVKRALEGSLDVKVKPSTSVYGDLFESLVILEVFRLNEYSEQDFRLSHFRTKSGFEIDLILSKGQKHLAIEIKSANKVRAADVESFAKKVGDLPGISQYYWVSNDPVKQTIAGIKCIYFRDFLSLLDKKNL